jgi:cephalosporin-C deacetylase
MDTAQLARIVRSLPFVDSNRVGVCGGSQGGGLSVACAALTPGINRACILMPFLSDYRRVWEMNLARGSYQEITDYFRHYDPHSTCAKRKFSLGWATWIRSTWPADSREVRLYVGLMDDTCPPSTQFAIYNRLTCEKDYRVFPDFGHESFPDTDEDTMLFLLAME